MHKFHLVVAALSALALAAFACGGAAASVRHAGSSSKPRSISSTPSADPAVIRDWNAIGVSVAANAKRPASETYLYLAFMHDAVYDALTSIEGGYEPYLATVEAKAGASAQAAAVAAAHRVLVTYFPEQQASLDASYGASLAALDDGAPKDDGVGAGEAAAAALIAARAGDGRNAAFPFAPAPAAGVWQPTFPAFLAPQTPWLAAVKPLVLESPDQFRPAAPPGLQTDRWAEELDEVQRLGGADSTERTAEQTKVARFWGDSSVGQYQRAFRAFSARRLLDIESTARLFAMLDTAAADALIGCFDGKYHYAFWRPVTAVRAADLDGNASTSADAGWTPLLVTPNHPEYPSAHGCLTGAIGETLAGFLGTRQIDFTVDSAVTGTERSYGSVRELEQEIVDSRLWAGLHYRFSSVAGVALGRHASNWITSHAFRPTR